MIGQTYFDDIDQVAKIQQTEKKNKKKANHKKAKKQKHDQIMKKLPPTCFSCSAHSDDFLRLNPTPTASRPTCKSCGFKLSGKLGYLICPKIVSCYVLCSSCKVCSSNHILRKMFCLNHLSENQLYSQNKFKCHGCKQEKAVDQKRGVYHCNVCAFSICADCMDKTQVIWQQKNVSQDQGDDQWQDA